MGQCVSGWKTKVQMESPEEAAKYRDSVTQADEAFVIYQLKEFIPRWSGEFKAASEETTAPEAPPETATAQDSTTVGSDLTTGSTKTKKKAVKGRKHEIRCAEYTKAYLEVGKYGPKTAEGKSWDLAFSNKVKECIEEANESRNLETFFEFVGNDRDEKKSYNRGSKSKKHLPAPVPYTLSVRSTNRIEDV